MIHSILFCLSLTALGADVEQLYKRARNGDSASLLELGSANSAEARAALELLSRLPAGAIDKFALRKAKARAGFADSQLDLAASVLFGYSGQSLIATRGLPYVGGPLSVEIFLLLLDDFTGATNNGDLHYLANAQNAVLVLSEAFPDAAQLPDASNVSDPDKSGPVWHEYFRRADDRWKIPDTQIDAWLKEIRRRPQLETVAAVSVLGGRIAYDAIRSPQFAVQNDSPAFTTLRLSLEAAYGDRPSDKRLVKAIRSLDKQSKRTVLKTLAFLKLPAGIPVLCQVLAIEDKRKTRASDLPSFYRNCKG